MSSPAPVIYLLNGEDEFAITQFLLKLQTDLGDPSLAAFNLTRLDGLTSNLDELLTVAGTMPFLTSRRLVILERPSARFNSPAEQKKFTAALSKIPSTTILAMVEYKILTSDQDRKKNKIHWLEEWAFAAGEYVHLKRFDPPKIADLSDWILTRAKLHGGKFTRPAAAELANLVGNEPRQVEQEILKLLEYVNYLRPVELEDVHHLTVDTREGSIFDLVDAMTNHNVRGALQTLERLLEQEEPFIIFSMIVRQYRLLIQAREIMDRGGDEHVMAKEAVDQGGRPVHSFVAKKTIGQARRYSLPVLEMIYHQLLARDEAMKSSQMPAELALETLVVELGQIHPVHPNPKMVG